MTLITDTDISFFGIEVQQTDCTFQFNKQFSEMTCYMRGKIDNASVAFLTSFSIYIIYDVIAADNYL